MTPNFLSVIVLHAVIIMGSHKICEDLNNAKDEFNRWNMIN